MRPLHVLLFLLFLAGLSRFLMAPNGPDLISAGFRFLGNLFKSTING
jgi:hypothetical protein